MKKFFKIVGIILLSLIVLVLIAGLIAPKKFQIERSLTINAPREKVWLHINTLEACHQWSPWIEGDPTVAVTYGGQSGTVGSTYTWNSKKVGAGTQTITKLDQGRRVESHLHFVEPFEGDADTFLDLQDEGGNTKVTWGFDTEYAYPKNVLLLIMPMKKMMGETFDKGLLNLKKLSEAN